MNLYLKICVLLLIVASCGKPKITNSRITPQAAPESIAHKDSKSFEANLSQVPSNPNVPNSNAALLNMMKSVVQIQITKPRCRDVDVDPVTLIKYREKKDETSYCTGTVINYNGRPFVVTAAHCFMSSCINNDATKPGFDPNKNGIYNFRPQIGGIKIPSQPQVAFDVPGTTTKKLPIMDDFAWNDSTKILVARDLEFVSGSSPNSVGNSFTGTVKKRLGNGDLLDMLCAASGKPLGKGLLTSTDIAVVDFGPDVAIKDGTPVYPMLQIPISNFQTSKLQYRSSDLPGGFRFMGLSFSDTTGVEPFQHFQKTFREANDAMCFSYGGLQSSSRYGFGLPVPFDPFDTNLSNSFIMSMGTAGCLGDSGGPMFEETPVPGGYTYQLAGIGSIADTKMSTTGRVARCMGTTTGTFTAIKPTDINTALNKIVGRTVNKFPENMPKTPAGGDVDIWYPVPAGDYVGQQNEDYFISAVFSSPTLISNSTTVLWKALTKSDGVTKIAEQVAGQALMAIATDGQGTRKATWKASSLTYGYYGVDIQYPKNINSASCLKLNYETNPLKVKTTKGSKVITIMAEGSPTFSLGAYSGNEIALGSPVKGVGIPAGATVAIVPTSRTSSTFTMSLAATATSVSTGTPMIITHTFRNLVDQKTGYSPGVDAFMNVTQNMLPYKRVAITNAKYESYVWVPALANTISPGSLTLIMHDKGCGTAAASAGRMSADTVIFTFVGGLK